MELLKEIGAFAWAIINGWAGYATGGIIVATLALWNTLRNSPTSRNVGVALAITFLLMAFFKAWQEQYERATKSPAAPTIQVTMPQITVPPAQVIVTPEPSPAPQQSHDLTGFLELAKTDMLASTIAKSSPISVNVGFVVKGTQPIEGAAYITAAILADYDKKLDAELEKNY